MVKITKNPSRPGIWATPDGRVFQELHVTRDSYGYGQVAIGERGQRGKVRRHVIICETFHGERPPGAVVRHKNGVPGDDREDNLEWGTQGENCQDTVQHGKSTQGSKNARHRLVEAEVVEIKQRLLGGEGTAELARWFGVSQPTISDIKTGRTWAHIKLED